ncbi:MAG: hemophore-related protein [Mycobacterium sp.]|nr:hemophore-related protein [Mycobacterium sp.]
MMLNVRAVVRMVAAGAAGCAVMCAGSPIAAADPAPNCTAADLARISAGVSNATADFLFGRPDVNAFFTGLKGQDPEMLSGNVEDYLNANPQVRADLQGIRQPLADFETRCQ